MREVVEGVAALVPEGGAIAVISSAGGLGFMAHLDEIKALMATDGYGGAIAWSDDHLDVVADGYLFSKEAIIVYTMSRSLELIGGGVRLNCLSPGPTETPMMPHFEQVAGAEVMKAFEGPVGRKARPEEMAWPLVFLNSDAAGYLTGSNLVVDAGVHGGFQIGALDPAAMLADAGR
jgi:NAD(P)-dependent dehydrogenase (short-subunit alcohol dehydrogenase family)